MIFQCDFLHRLKSIRGSAPLLAAGSLLLCLILGWQFLPVGKTAFDPVPQPAFAHQPSPRWTPNRRRSGRNPPRRNAAQWERVTAAIQRTVLEMESLNEEALSEIASLIEAGKEGADGFAQEVLGAGGDDAGCRHEGRHRPVRVGRDQHSRRSCP